MAGLTLQQRRGPDYHLLPEELEELDNDTVNEEVNQDEDEDEVEAELDTTKVDEADPDGSSG